MTPELESAIEELIETALSVKDFVPVAWAKRIDAVVYQIESLLG